MNIDTGSVGQGGSATSLSLVAVVMVYGCMDSEAVSLAYPYVDWFRCWFVVHVGALACTLVTPQDGRRPSWKMSSSTPPNEHPTQQQRHCGANDGIPVPPLRRVSTGQPYWEAVQGAKSVHRVMVEGSAYMVRGMKMKMIWWSAFYLWFILLIMIDCSMSPVQCILVSSLGCSPSTSLPKRVLCESLDAFCLCKIRVPNLGVCMLDSSFVSIMDKFILMMAWVNSDCMS